MSEPKTTIRIGLSPTDSPQRRIYLLTLEQPNVPFLRCDFGIDQIEAVKSLINNMIGYKGGINKIERYFCARCNTEFKKQHTRHEMIKCSECGQTYYACNYLNDEIKYIEKIEEQPYFASKVKVEFEYYEDDNYIELQSIYQYCQELGVEVIYE